MNKNYISKQLHFSYVQSFSSQPNYNNDKFVPVLKLLIIHSTILWLYEDIPKITIKKITLTVKVVGGALTTCSSSEELSDSESEPVAKKRLILNYHTTKTEKYGTDKIDSQAWKN